MSVAVISATVSGADWVGRSKAEDSWTSFNLVKVFGDRVFSIAKHITQNDSDAEDVLIETFLEVCSDLEGYREEELRHRLVTIAVREAFLELRQRGEGRPPLGQSDDLSIELMAREPSFWGDDYQQKEQTSHVLENSLRSLDPITRTIFVLRDIEQISVEHIAEIVNRSVAAVEARLLRARL
jgi:RNA polymerase sigma-70 factor (ECF subfamily)